MKKICYVATIPAVVHAFLRGHIKAAAEKYEITVVCNSNDIYLLEGLHARVISLPIERKPSPRKDLLVLIQLVKLFRRERFEIVHSIMPKTGMIAMLSARLTCLPTRLHTFTGQVWATQKGAPRILYRWFDKMIARFANCVLTDSPSQRDFLVNQGVMASSKVGVIGSGSISGVDPKRFHPNSDARKAVRDELGIAQEARVILFVGRLNRDKGVLDLAMAFNSIVDRYQDTVLLFVGAQEDVPFSCVQDICSNHANRVHHVSFTSEPERYMASADIFCLPSYREGFGTTIIEAAACAMPAVASRIYGITDAVIDGETGLLVGPGDVATLSQALSTLISQNDLRRKMGIAARQRALELFPSEKITQEMVSLYDRLSAR